jgi:hypothetical protein
MNRLGNAASALASELAELLQQDQVVADQVLFLLEVLKPAGRWDSSSIARLAEDSRSLADMASGVVIASNVGRPSDDERYVAVSCLQQIVVKFTGASTKYTYREETDEYSGPLFLLVRAFLDAEGSASGAAIAPLDATVAQNIRRAFPKKRRATKLPQK